MGIGGVLSALSSNAGSWDSGIRSPAVSTGATCTAAPRLGPAVLSSVRSLSEPGRGLVLGIGGGGTAAFDVDGGRIVSTLGRIATIGE